MLEYILVFALGLFVGIGIDDMGKEDNENIRIRQQTMILQKIQEDRNRGYAPSVDKYKEIYNKYK